MTTTDNVLDIRSKVDARVAAEEVDLVFAASAENKLTSEFIISCARSGELGDGTLFSEMYKDQFLFNNGSGEWLSWADNHWTLDQMNKALGSVEGIARLYLDEIRVLNKQIAAAAGSDDDALEKQFKAIRKILNDKANKLRGARGRNNCLELARTIETPMAIKGTELDDKPWLLACSNGVIDLKTGLSSQGYRDDFMFKASPAEWKGLEEPAPAWEAALIEIFDGNIELVDFFRRLCGYSITGLSTEHVFPVLCGQGRNGKSLIIETIRRVLGELSGPIQAEMLLDQGRSRSSTAPSPDIMSLRGLRFAYASETDYGRKISPSRVKWLTGGDELVGRYPFDKYDMKFKPTHTLFLLTNHKPHAPADDFAFWERLRLIPFNLSFVDREPQAENERKADKFLPVKLIAETSGILAWLVRGCLEWQKFGLKPPAAVLAATAEYQRDEDFLADFLEACCVIDSEAEVGSTKIYAVFKEWFEEHIGKNAPKQKTFGTIMKKRFHWAKSGTYKYFGLRLNNEANLL